MEGREKKVQGNWWFSEREDTDMAARSLLKEADTEYLNYFRTSAIT